LGSSLKRLRLDALIRERHQLSWGKARDWIASGKVWIDGKPATDPAFEVEENLHPEIRMNTPRKRPVPENSPANLQPEVVHVDTQIIVINKPSGMSTVPFRDERDTLDQWASRHLGDRKVKIVQRLDRETSGLIVFARTREAEEKLANQFRFHTIHRRYLALAHGEVTDQTIRSALVENRGDGLRGSVRPGSSVSRDGAKTAITHVRAKEYFDGFTLIECELETGRTHQIRIHLSEAGHPLLGEKAYHRDYQGQWIEAPRVMLHAAELGFTHPTREEPMLWKQPLPKDFRMILTN
jgi:23S rRNA pseudouridine1911/1915/1917 synthase